MITLNCINPKGEFEVPLSTGLVNPRVKDLSGKKIAIIWDGKKGGDNFCIAVEELLKERYPTAVTTRLVWGDAEAAEKAKKEMDTFIYGVGDNGMGGWIQCRQVVALEKMGKPGVFVVGDNATHTARMSAEDSGMPTLRIVSLPSIDYYPNRISVERIRPCAAASIDEIIDALVRPLSPEEKNAGLKIQQKPVETVTITGEDYESALETLNQSYLENHWGDGLPLIPPTETATQHMLTGTTRSPEEI
ncbi:MAG: hypothetical protein PVJ08_09535, partial [Dehalococcoidia bacterium]